MSHMKRRILWINPVGFPDYDQPMGEYMDSIKAEGTEIEVISLSTDAAMNNLEYRTYEALISGDIVKVTRYAAENGFDGIVIGCFYDPALEEAREISGEAIVVGPCQASVQIAANLAHNFSVIIGQDKWRAQMTERVEYYGYGSRLASMRAINIAANDLQKDCALTQSRIIEEGRKAVEEDGAEALILGCTCNFGLTEIVSQTLGVPVIDPVIAAFKTVEHLSGLKKQFGWIPSRKWGSEAPPEDQIKAFGLFSAPAPIGNKINF